MPKLKPYKFRVLKKRLLAYDERFEFYQNRGKGSHRIVYHPDILGRPVSFPIICRGDGTEIPKQYIGDLIRAFRLPKGVL